MMLSTVEALAASCIILGERAQGELLMSKFGWGHSFLSLNAEPLKDYEAATNSREVVAAQLQYVED
jgi:pre-rRNA-processing protein TSR3